MLKRKIFYGIVLACILVINILYVDYEPYALFIIMIWFPIIMWIILKLHNYYFDIKISMQNETVVRGEVIEINIDARNDFALPVSMVVVRLRGKYSNHKEESVHTLSFSVPQKGEIRIKTSIKPKYCGFIYVYVEDVQIFDYISMHKVKNKCDSHCSITVMPKLYKPVINTDHFSGINVMESDEYSATRHGDDPSEIFDLREYVDGDNLNRIHWKLSSKSDTFIVKEFSMPLKKMEVVLVELVADKTQEGKRQMDGLYETVFALGNYILNGEVGFRLVCFDKHSKSLRSAMVENFQELEMQIKNILQMDTYEKPYAQELFWVSEMSENARVHYIRCQELKDKKTSERKNIINFMDSSIFLIGEENTQDLVDSFYLNV